MLAKGVGGMFLGIRISQPGKYIHHKAGASLFKSVHPSKASDAATPPPMFAKSSKVF
jgi:hypothetical protein